MWSSVAALLVVLVVVMVVRSRPPDPVAVRANADLAYALTVGSAEQVGRLVEELHPEVVFVEPGVDRPVRSDVWYRCGDGHYDGVTEPRAISWTSIRGRWAEPARETATLLPPLIEALEDEGWEVTEDFTDFERVVVLRRSGFTLQVSGWLTVPEEYPASVSIRVTSPCVDAPEGQDDWQWTPGPTEAPWPEE